MIKKVVIASISFVLLYIGFIQLQVHWVSRDKSMQKKSEGGSDVTNKVYAFSFAKYTSSGKKEIEIEGDSADILTQTVDLMNVVAKAYAEEVPVTITADRGNYDKAANKVHLRKNVVATTENGTRLLTEELDIHPEKHTMETKVMAEVKKDNINVKGLGAQGDSQLKKVQFKKKVTVMVQDPDVKDQGPTIITCDGPLIVDYEKNIAHFKDNVTAEDARGKLTADVMDVYYNKVSRRVSKIVAIGNVVIESPDGNKTYSDNVIYLADEGRVILGGDAEALYVEGSDVKANENQAFPIS
ncbi:MAG: LPS export ABC transporter periplasmic protein LptC [Candidatus Omnitrophica bacterium]|nr:LPS export ABC transporter periplasmic protein LptC [Candidatus Omnitrophota bacterium]